ncbi:MAG: RagB/SusD family nutrient uptake outer membrane protein [Pedobacter sp.]|nr:RagB/SusD family nutrient uptake outer membrane protein [Pedobacter sp.]
MKNSINKNLWIGIILILITSCKKDFLEVKPNKALLVPTTLSDFDALLDNNASMNRSVYGPIVASDDLVAPDAAFNNASFTIKSAYSWGEIGYGGDLQVDWIYSYVQIFYSNIVLDGLEKIKENESIAYKNVKGSALFFRAFAASQLLMSYTLAYQKSTALKELGIPILLTSDVNQKYSRGNLQQSYDQVISDLKEASSLLTLTSSNAYRPNKAAAHGLLSRIYLSMGNYQSALLEADNSLKLSSKLIDYTMLTLNPLTATNPYPKIFPINLNPEVLFHAGVGQPFVNAATTAVNPEIVSAYANNDLRKAGMLYDRGGGLFTFKGRYSGSTVYFSGVAVNEVLLTRAECLVRSNKPLEALADLNSLLIYRYKTGAYQPYTISNTPNVLKLILAERRKELLFTGLRWLDLKRLNLEPDHAVTLTRTINGKTHVLLPNSNRYAFQIPDEEIIVSGIEQNLK